MENFERPYIAPEKIPPAFRAKWSVEVLSEGFTPLPKRLLRCLGEMFSESNGLERLAVVLAIVDAKRPRPAGWRSFPTLDYLAFNAGMRPDAFRDHLDAMQKDGILKASGTDEALDLDLGPFEERLLQVSSRDAL